MSWENILKRPMNPNLRSERDNQYKEAIIAYDRDVITPSFEEAMRKQPALENEKLGIFFLRDDTKDKPVVTKYYGIGKTAVRNLGGNKQFILKVLSELYKNAGYNVTISGEELTFSQ